jgi:hypothetical protein
MTQLVYRGNSYFKEEQAEVDRKDWNLRHRPSLWLTYRCKKYRPFQVGGQVKVG